MQNTNPKGVIKMLIEKVRHKVTLDDVAVIISICGQLRHCPDISMNFLTIEQLQREPSQLQRKVLKVFIIQIGKSNRLQNQTIQKVSYVIDETVSEINQQNVNTKSDGPL